MRATNGPGIRWLTLGHNHIRTIDAPARAMACQVADPRWAAYDCHFSKNGAGTAPMRRPSTSFTWLEKITTAMPLVNPMTTGCGTNLIATPSRAAPSAMRMTPAMSVATVRPSTPYFWTMPYTMTTNAPVGPPIWTREPPNAEMMNPATIAV